MDIGNQVNEVINNICDKLGTTATNLVPMLARYKSANALFGVIACSVLIVAFIVIAVLTNKKAKLANFDDPNEEWIIRLLALAGVCICTAILLYNAYNLVGWIASPEAKSIDYITNLLRNGV